MMITTRKVEKPRRLKALVNFKHDSIFIRISDDRSARLVWREGKPYAIIYYASLEALEKTGGLKDYTAYYTEDEVVVEL